MGLRPPLIIHLFDSGQHGRYGRRDENRQWSRSSKRSKVKGSRKQQHIWACWVWVEVTLTIEPQFKLQYGFKKGRDDNLENEIEAMVREHPYARVMWFAGNGRYVMDYYDRVDNDTHGDSQHNLWTSSGGVFRIVGDSYHNSQPSTIESAVRRASFGLVCGYRPSTQRFQLVEARRLVTQNARFRLFDWPLSLGQSKSPKPNDGGCFPLRRLKEWMADVRAIIAENRACFPILGIYLRFSKASDRWMGFNYGEDVVAEIHVPKVANETYYERSAAVYDEIQQMTLKKYGGRPHWGKNSTPVFVGLGPAQYPQWNAFMDLKRTMDPTGLFDNKTNDRLCPS